MSSTSRAPDQAWWNVDPYRAFRIDRAHDRVSLSDFFKYWYEHDLALRAFEIQQLVANGGWFAIVRQEITRLVGLQRQRANWAWPLPYSCAVPGVAYFALSAQGQSGGSGPFWFAVCVGEDARINT